MRVFTHHHHDIRSDAWRHCECNAGIGAPYFVTDTNQSGAALNCFELQYFFFSAQTIFLALVCQKLFLVRDDLHNLPV